MSHKMLILVILLLFAQIANAQTAVEKKPTDDPEKLKKEAVLFLRETSADVNTLRTLENRISFAAELAGLMWFHNEKEARAMFAAAIGDFKQLLMQYDVEMNSLGMADAEEGSHGGFMVMMNGPDDRSRLHRKFSTAMAVRNQIAGSLAEHDPEMAFAFYNDSTRIISNAEFRKQMESRDQHFEQQLLNQIAGKNPAKAAQLGAKSLDKGVNYYHVELLKKIYAKDADKGAEFAAAILKKVITDKQESGDFHVLGSLLSYGSDALENSKKEGGKKAVYNQQELREIAESFGQAILGNEESGSSGLEYADDIEKFAPARAAQIRTKYKDRNLPVSTPLYGSNATFRAQMASNSMANSANSMGSAERSVREQLEREKAEQQLLEDVKSLDTKQLPKEEREKIIIQARKILLQTPGKDKKIVGLSMLAAQVSKDGDKELAADIMKDAQNLVNPQPKNYQDFLLTWMLVSGYAEADPEKAFPLLEDTIMRANETISAFIKVGEFIDVAGEMIQDGEVQVGAFGGSMIRGLTSELGMADATLQTLAKADFTKMKTLTNRFERTEVRILAKMLILRAVLGGKEKVPGEIEMMQMTDGESIIQTRPPPPPPPRRRPN